MNPFERRRSPVILLLFSIIISAASIYWYRCSSNSSDPGRGGALAVAISLFYLFIERSSGSQLLNLLYTRVDPVTAALTDTPDDIEAAVKQLKRQHDTLITRMLRIAKLDSHDKKWNNIFLALSSAIATVAWGFGDWAVKLLNWLQWAPCPPAH